MKTKAHSPPASERDARPHQHGGQPCLASLYSRLAKVGFTRKFIKSTILPSWVCDQAEKDPDVFPELALFLGKALGISSRSLADPTEPLIFCNPSPARYKPATGTVPAEERIAPAKSVNQQIALEVEACLPKDSAFVASELDPTQIRNYILGSSKKLDFKSLLAYCWHSGIVVLPAVEMHNNSAPKFTGMITWQKGRPFIFLRGNAKDTSWGLFVLAHELAHLALEHVKEGDAAFIEESCDLNSISDEEVAANEWALSLILGENKNVMSDFIRMTPRITAKQLAQMYDDMSNNPNNFQNQYGDIVKKTEGGPKLYHIENNLVLASFAASSLYGMFLHAALTVCINLVDEYENRLPQETKNEAISCVFLV